MPDRAQYERRHLEYALERVTFGGAQKRLQNALTIGALDKGGLIPLVIGVGLFIAARWPTDFPQWKDSLFFSNPPFVVGIAVGLVLIYLAALSQHRALGRS